MVKYKLCAKDDPQGGVRVPMPLRVAVPGIAPDIALCCTYVSSDRLFQPVCF